MLLAMTDTTLARACYAVLLDELHCECRCIYQAAVSTARISSAALLCFKNIQTYHLFKNTPKHGTFAHLQMGRLGSHPGKLCC